MPVPEQTPEGAVAFLEWWIAVLNYAELTGETDVLRQNSEADCDFCNGRVGNIDRIYSSGGRFERDSNTTSSDLLPSPVDLNGYVAIDFTGYTPQSRVVTASGVVESTTSSEGPLSFVAGLRWVNGKWSLRGIGDA